ncbi:MAG: acetyl-CoA carboxylase biotin carboxyl carrier protein [Janthinobacterium lividum]
MDREVIKALIEALAASDLAELEYCSNGETLRLVKRGASAPAHFIPANARPSASGQPTPLPAPPDAVPETVIAPLYGVVHLQQVPDAPPFVSAGQSVTVGQVLCVVEAMKVFSQIRAGRDCVIASVLVESGQEVEAGQPLFRLV